MPLSSSPGPSLSGRPGGTIVGRRVTEGGGGRSDPVAVLGEQMGLARDLEADAVAEPTGERRRHARHERQRLASVLDGKMDEDRVAEVLDRADLSNEGTFAHLQCLWTNADRDGAGGVRDHLLAGPAQRKRGSTEPQ